MDDVNPFRIAPTILRKTYLELEWDHFCGGKRVRAESEQHSLAC